MSQRILTVSDLTVSFDTDDGVVQAVRGINGYLDRGECLGIVGESGSGKSQTFLAAMGLTSSNGHTNGKIEFKGQDLLSLKKSELNKIRGDKMSMIFQDPLTSLTSHLPIGKQMQEVLRTHRNIGGREAMAICLDWLERVQMPEAKRRLKQYPHELSGGMRQRIMIAMAMLCEPDLLIADEPTTALDVTIQAEILDIMDNLRREQGTAIALITHDMGVVARMCDRIQVMRHGEYVEEGSVEDIFYNPQHEYTNMLLDSVPHIDVTGAKPSKVSKVAIYEDGGRDFLRAEDLRVEFKVARGMFAKPAILRAVDGVSFDLQAGETLGIVGESGSGKSTLARAVLQLIPPTSGTVSWLGSPLNNIQKDELKAKRRDLQIVFQDPLASLDPSKPIGASIMEPLTVFESQLSKAEMRERVNEVMLRVGLNASFINRYPHELSGGQNQRVGIARAIITKPKLVICDEAVSALDVSIQSQIIDLLMDLQKEFGLSFIFISHDLSVVWEISHRILVLYLGTVVELTDTSSLFSNPQHPYTQQLISSVPLPDPKIERKRQRIKLVGEMSSPMDPAARLRFLPSKMHLMKDGYIPKLEERFPGHFVAEHDDISELLIS
ncbi:ABC transporter ATP-binding protein [Leucothrix arctica]|uniref:ABC transporter ATP-binding protein n=1 Tax=Leucothrix arctica TaxID=1481894 RepID=A0A317CDW1_9GAMM|nr:ABC transporter ATP-binding protein [Leucothrix arctica]PWQ94490.1 ABC transporter ATP-binding protein [Leucothrix arctica]